MKSKKKSVGTVRKGGAKKPQAARPVALLEKSLVTTKEKTNTTMEDHF